MNELRSWYVRNNEDQSYGPYLWSEIVSYAQEGRITFASSLKCPFQTSNKWVDASTLTSLKPHFAPPIQGTKKPEFDFFPAPTPATSSIEVDVMSVYEPSRLPARRKPKKRDTTIRRFIEIAFGGLLALALYMTVLKEHVIPPLQAKVKEFISNPAPEVREATQR